MCPCYFQRFFQKVVKHHGIMAVCWQLKHITLYLLDCCVTFSMPDILTTGIFPTLGCETCRRKATPHEHKKIRIGLQSIISEKKGIKHS